jgi:universal stress protein E
MPDESPSADALRSILVASDLTEGSGLGIETAAALAATTGAALHAVHCVPKPVFPYWEGLLDEATRERWIENARQDLEWQLRRLLGPEPPVASVNVGVGEAARRINERAAETAADLIVLGRHRPRGPLDDLLGSTADRVVRTAAVPCLLANRPVTGGLRRVIVAVDFSEPSAHALRVGLDWVRRVAAVAPEGRVTVEILYVSAFASPAARPVAVEPRLSREAEAARDMLAPLPNVEVLPRILSAPLPAEGVLRAAEEAETSLIVLGTHGYGGLARALLGSVASAVARTVPYPVLLVPPPGGISPPE